MQLEETRLHVVEADGSHQPSPGSIKAQQIINSGIARMTKGAGFASSLHMDVCP